MSKYILGLDLGVQSIGWAIIPVNPKKGPELRLGVRCFDAKKTRKQHKRWSLRVKFGA